MDGVGNWLEILMIHIPEHEMLNYCVSFYYNRSMVTLASLITEKFRDVAYCPGNENKTFHFPKDLIITEMNEKSGRKLADLKGNKTIVFVSDDCPVSMIETVVRARRLADQEKSAVLIVTPLENFNGFAS